MRVIHVSPEFPLNRRMRKDVRRGKLQVVREGGKILSLGGGIPFGKRRGGRTPGSRLVCMVDNGAEVGGGHYHWKVLDHPGESHPDFPILQEVDKTLGNAQTLPIKSHHFKKRLARLTDDLQRRAERIQNHRHTIAFIGMVGDGKTSAICGITEMLCESKRRSKGRPPSMESVLLTAAGRTTLCEVRVMRGGQLELIVEPCSDSEVKAHVADFCAACFAELNPSSEDGDVLMKSEMDRVIRNMSGLTRSQDKPDPALELAKACGCADRMKEKVLSRMILPRRRERRLLCEDLEATRAGYRDINNGKAPKFSIPRQMDVVVPFSLLGTIGQKSGLDITFVDTKGVEPGAFSRPDLERHLDADGTIVVLCSRFNDAPGKMASEVLERIKAKKMEGNIAEIAAKASVLVLPRADESEQTMRDNGDFVETREEAYEIKAEQAKPGIRQLAVGDIPIFFYDWKEDDINSVRDFLFERVQSLRKFYRDELCKINKTVGEMMDNHEKADFQTQQEESARQLGEWVRSNKICEPNVRVCDKLLAEIRRTPYPSSLRAAVNRSGIWYKFDYYHFLGIGAQEMVKSRIGEWRGNFRVIAEKVETDGQLAKARNFVCQIREWVDDECEKLLAGIYEKSGEFFKSAFLLESGADTEAPMMWENCVREWGRGHSPTLGRGDGHPRKYKERIEDHSEHGFVRSKLGVRIGKLADEYFLDQWREIQEQLLARLSVEDDADIDTQR